MTDQDPAASTPRVESTADADPASDSADVMAPPAGGEIDEDVMAAGHPGHDVDVVRPADQPETDTKVKDHGGS
jgi:hypothetical protein